MKNIRGKKIAVLTENGFEESELTFPKKTLEEAGAMVYIVSQQKKRVKAWQHDHWTVELPVDVNIAEAHAENYDALVLPGGVLNPDKLRTDKQAVEFATRFIDSNKPVAAICHGPQLLIETGRLHGKQITSYMSIKTDLQNAGAQWVDKEVVRDGNLITSRSPADLDAFCKKLIEVLGEDKPGEKSSFDNLTFKYSNAMS